MPLTASPRHGGSANNASLTMHHLVTREQTVNGGTKRLLLTRNQNAAPVTIVIFYQKREKQFLFCESSLSWM